MHPLSDDHIVGLVYKSRIGAWRKLKDVHDLLDFVTLLQDFRRDATDVQCQPYLLAILAGERDFGFR